MIAKTALLLVASFTFILNAGPASAADDSKPLKVLLVTGGCCHDYAKQKDLLKKGIEVRANAQVDIIFVADDSTHPQLPIYGHPDYAKGYDVVPQMLKGFRDGLSQAEVFDKIVGMSEKEFDKAFGDQNKSSIIAELMRRAVRERQLQIRRERLFRQLSSARVSRPSFTSEEVRRTRAAERP